MSSRITFFEFSKRDKTHRITNELTNICSVCGKDIDVGDKVCSKYCNGRKRRIYHVECAEKVNLL